MFRYMDGWDYGNDDQNVDGLLYKAQGWFGTALFNVSVQSPGRFGFGKLLGFYGRGSPGQVRGTKALNQVMVSSEGSIWGVAVKIPGINDADAGSPPSLFLYSGQSSLQVLTLTFQFLGVIQLITSAPGRTYRSITGRYRDNTWMYVQIKNEGAGNPLTVLLNGETLFSDPTGGLSADFDSWGGVAPASTNATNSIEVDDMYICDLQGGVNDDFLGNVRVTAQLPVGAGDSTDLTVVGAASNWQAASDPTMPTGKYNYTPTVGDYDLYEMNPGIDAREIFGIMVSGAYAQDNGVQLYGQNVMKTGGTEFFGVARGLFQLPGYFVQDDCWDRNPDTTDPWTDTELNLVQAGPLLESTD